jgi:hypothetical protein
LKKGIILRRDMGSLGVSSFQQVYGALLADALGPNFRYWDEWQMASGLLRPGLQHTPDDAGQMIHDMEKDGLPAYVAKPRFQDEGDPRPWNMSEATAQEWVLGSRSEVCHGERREGLRFHAVRIQGNFQHAAYFRRYRTFIHTCVLRSPQDFTETFYRPEVTGVMGQQQQKQRQTPKQRQKQQLRKGGRRKRGRDADDGDDDDDGDEEDEKEDEKEDEGGKVKAKPLASKETPAEVVVYLRLGDKAEAGDTLLTFESGYYDAVLTKVRPQHDTCWIVTVTVK